MEQLLKEMTSKQAMYANDIVLKLMKEQNIRKCEMARMLGLSKPAFSNRLSPKKTKNMTLNTLGEMLYLLGYHIEVVEDYSDGESAYRVEVELRDGLRVR